MQIYEISKEVVKAMELEDDEQREYLLSQLQLNLEERSADLLKFCKTQESFNEAVDIEISRLQGLKLDRNKRVEFIKKTIKEAMENAGIKKMELPNFKLTVANNAPSVVIENESLVPKTFWREKTVHSIDKVKIKEALKADKEVKGAKLESKTSLRIK